MRTTKSTGAAPAGARILLVDDNKFGLSARKCVLEELGCMLTTSSCPKKALELFAEHDFDLLITDYNMPEMNGRDLICQIRTNKPLIPVILISGFVDALGLDEKNTGADIVIQKSAHEVGHLIRGVQRLLARKPMKKPPQRNDGRDSGRRAKGG